MANAGAQAKDWERAILLSSDPESQSLPDDKIINYTQANGKKTIESPRKWTWTMLEQMAISVGRIPDSTRTLLCKGKIPERGLPPNLARLFCKNIQNEVIPRLPDSLRIFYCSDSKNVKFIEAGNLPHNLVRLQINNTSIKILPKLNDRLINLNCRNNEIVTILELPDKLQGFQCSENQLERIPDLPDSLTVLECNNNNIKALPQLSMTKLTKIDAAHNNIKSLPPLPNTLRTLNLYLNPLETVHSFNPGLVFVNFYNCKVSVLPPLPQSLETLILTGNPIAELPKLNNSLEQLHCEGCAITKIPLLPDSVKWVNFGDCPLDPEFMEVQNDYIYLLNQNDTVKGQARAIENLREAIEEIQDRAEAPPDTLWKGWNQADIAKLDIIFETEPQNNSGLPTAANQAACPVCLKFVERSEACMYMKHNCKELGGYYHRNLYKKYRNDEGAIGWCTICGRIALGHRHQKLARANDKVPQLEQSGRPFEVDCSISSHGGGLLEKLTRFRRLRETALDLQEQVDKIQEQDALADLTEKMWNAPMTKAKGHKQKMTAMLRNKAWNIPSNVFPAPPRPPNAGPATAAAALPPAPNVPRPAGNAGLVPVVEAAGDNIFGNEGPMIHFRHRNEDGSVNEHDGSWITKESLENFIRGAVKNFGDASFGFCQMYPGQCKAKLQPEEIREFIPPELQEEQRLKFNRKFAQAGGRKTRRQLRRKPRRKSQRGGMESIFVEATDAQCIPPWTEGAGTATRKRRNRRDRRSRRSPSTRRQKK